MQPPCYLIAIRLSILHRASQALVLGLPVSWLHWGDRMAWSQVIGSHDAARLTLNAYCRNGLQAVLAPEHPLTYSRPHESQ
ncbi:MAG TPA: hypothetical protein ACQGQH_10520 [Xylella sp.]